MTGGPLTAVVGGGLLGAALALSLARLGQRVVVLDAGPVRPQASRAAMGWINAAEDVDGAYFALRMRAIAGWRALLAQAPDLPLRFAGGIGWAETEARTEARARNDESRGYPVRRLGPADLAALAPGLAAAPPLALFCEAEGCADPGRIGAALLGLAAAAGAEVREGVEVAGLVIRAGRLHALRLADGTGLPVAQAAIAAGVSSRALLAETGFDLPMVGGPGVLLRTAPLAPVTTRFLNLPGFYGWQMPDGRVMAGAGHSRVCGPVGEAALVAEVCARIGALMPAAGPVQVERVRSAVRPLTPDDRPAAGPVPGVEGLHLLVSHSGVTLAPALGAALAAEIATGTAQPVLAPYRPARFLALRTVGRPRP